MKLLSSEKIETEEFQAFMMEFGSRYFLRQDWWRLTNKVLERRSYWLNGNLATQLPQSTSNPLGAKDHVIGIKYTEKHCKAIAARLL